MVRSAKEEFGKGKCRKMGDSKSPIRFRPFPVLFVLVVSKKKMYNYYVLFSNFSSECIG